MDGVIFLDNVEGRVYVGAIAADLHCGAIEAKQWFFELSEGYLSYLEGLAILDYVIIAGDYFDSKISLNGESAQYGLKFLMSLLRICEEKGSKLRIVKGTESHDNRQLEILSVIAKSTKCDVRIIENVESEWLFHDLHVLYIPEEYMSDKDEFYKEHFSEKYDLVIGHGLVDEALYFAAKQESETTMLKAPVHSIEKLLEICHGYVFFGHIHKRIVLRERFRYVNSYSRWAFGEEDEKGFCMYFYDPVSKIARDEYIINEHARKFDTVEVICNPNAVSNEKEQVDYLVNLASTLMIDYIRLEITIPEEHPNPALITNLINETFQKHKNVKVKLINNGKLRKEKEVDDKIKHLLERYSFVFDKKALPEEKLVEFIKIHYKKEINIDKMRKYLYDSLTKGA